MSLRGQAFQEQVGCRPALRRVEPAMTSGPGAGVMANSDAPRQLRIGRATDPDRQCAQPIALHPPRPLHRGSGRWRRSHIIHPGRQNPGCADRGRRFRVVFRGLGGTRKRRFAACNNPLHKIRRNIERRRALRSVENTETSARSSANIEQSAAITERLGDAIYRARNIRQLAGH